MFEHIMPLIDVVQTELLLFASFCFLVGSIDDLAFDGLWFVHAIKRKWLFAHGNYVRATAETLPLSEDRGPLAIFVPAWREAPVIGAMLRRCLRQWTYPDYRIYVGCYPNDEETVIAVALAARGSGNIRLVICETAGPTSKADCLNRCWRALCHDEIMESRTYRAVVLHDAEDLVHPNALDLFGHLIGRAALIQLPVIPRRATRSRWIAGHYGDEFAELHGKQMVVREALGVSIPSAGVGCAFSRKALGELAARNGGKPFDATSMTEDYELGLSLTNGSARGIFARLRDRQGQLVATQEFFPENLGAAVRQKSRWMAGIALTGWDRLGWTKSVRENWIRLRDRKASFAAILLALAYLAVVLTGFLALMDLAGVYQPRPIPGFLKAMLLVNAAFLAWRLAMKGYFVFALYGFREALLSVPRTLVANIVNVLVVCQAMNQYLSGLAGSPARWEKTDHFYPQMDDIQQLKSTRTSTRND